MEELEEATKHMDVAKREQILAEARGAASERHRVLKTGVDQ